MWRCPVGMIAGAVALIFSGSAWADPVGLICDQAAFYDLDGHRLNNFGSLAEGGLYIFDED